MPRQFGLSAQSLPAPGLRAARGAHAASCGLRVRREQLSYGELNERANQVAHYLQQRGMGPGQRVGIFVERSLDMMVGLLGIQKSGRRLCSARSVLSGRTHPPDARRRPGAGAADAAVFAARRCPSIRPKSSVLMPTGRRLPQQPTTNPKSVSLPEDLVYVIFTSGSTGTPKGVQVPHGAVVNLLTFDGAGTAHGAGRCLPCAGRRLPSTCASRNCTWRWFRADAW